MTDIAPEVYKPNRQGSLYPDHSRVPLTLPSVGPADTFQINRVHDLLALKTGKQFNSKDETFYFEDKSTWIVQTFNSLEPEDKIELIIDCRKNPEFSRKVVDELTDLYLHAIRKDNKNTTTDSKFIFYDTIDLLDPSSIVLDVIPENERNEFIRTKNRLINVCTSIANLSNPDDANAGMNLFELKRRRTNGMRSLLQEVHRRMEAGSIETYQKLFRMLQFWDHPETQKILTEDILRLDYINMKKQPDWSQYVDEVIRRLWSQS